MACSASPPPSFLPCLQRMRAMHAKQWRYAVLLAMLSSFFCKF